ncbi:MAG: diaminopimelate epimerase [Bacteroidota bacterium]
MDKAPTIFGGAYLFIAMINFEKFQATGNDFILIDNMDLSLDVSVETISKMCDRKFGIGSDGLILIQPHEKYDFEMVFYNPDGSQSLCGNGSRCAVNFAKELGLIQSQSTAFLAYDGPHNAEILTDGQVKLKMSDVQNVRLLPDGMFVDTGSPHLVKYIVNIANYPVFDEGKSIRNGGLFAQAGVNVNFVEISGENEIKVRTYERGVENETLSCGTGVTAAAITSSHKGLSSPISIKTRGGDLRVEFKKETLDQFTDVYLIGPAVKVFSGSFQ